MKVLVVNLDKAIFEPNSASLDRLKDYAAFCEKLSVIVLTRQKFAPIAVGNLSIFATGSSCRLKYTFDALRLAKKIIAGGAPPHQNWYGGMDLVMTQDPFDTGHIGWLIKRRFKIPWQCQVHTDFLSPYFWRESLSNKIRVFLAGFLLPKADGLRVVSRRIAEGLKTKNYKLETDPVVLPIFVDAEKIKNAASKIDLKQKYPQFDFLILAASRLSREKNVKLAIAAMAEVIARYPKAGLLIVGEGAEYENLKLKTQNLSPCGRPPVGWKLASNIIFEPWTDDLISYLKSADLFLLTSDYEGWGMSVVEALSAGCPVLMTDVGCAGELVKNGKSGLIVPVRDERALAAAVEKMIVSPELRRQFSEAGLKTAANLVKKEQYLDVYKKSWEMLLKK